MKEILSQEEKAKIISRGYVGDCVYKAFMDQSDWMHDYYVKMVKKDYRAFELNDGIQIALNLHQPKIQNTIYYNDECEGPDVNQNNFINYNIKFIDKFNPQQQYSIFKEKEHYYIVKPGSNHWHSEKIRDLTPKEKEEINNVYLENIEKFKKRLITYWKKYNDKIDTYGYWANR